MRRASPRRVRLAILCLTLVSPVGTAPAEIPVIYSTDLFHPPVDPDDHYDLATLFALPELDIRAILVDMSCHRGVGKEPGRVTLRQMFHLSGKTVPWATGLEETLRAPDDPATDRPESEQGAVKLILSSLDESEEKVHLFITGSLLDVAAAYNREPVLFRKKVAALHVNAGTGPEGYQEEWNVRLDPKAYQQMMLSGLPVRWYPCFGSDGYATHFTADQTAILEKCALPLRAYFVYALTGSEADPIPFLEETHPVPTGPRNLWCMPAFIELAGRKIHATERGYEALPRPPSPEAEPVVVYQMRPVRLKLLSPGDPGPVSGIHAHYLGRTEDRIGKTGMAPDGEPDCAVRIHGLPPGKAIREATLRGPREGLWLSRPDPVRWRVTTRWNGGSLEVLFSFWASGMHRLELSWTQGGKETVPFHVPYPGSPRFQAGPDVSVDVSKSDIRVLRKQEPAYTRVLSSCLKNLLESFPLSHDLQDEKREKRDPGR